jgi:hypothetical protein
VVICWFMAMASEMFASVPLLTVSASAFVAAELAVTFSHRPYRMHRSYAINESRDGLISASPNLPERQIQ